jgi:hypothetical protein
MLGMPVGAVGPLEWGFAERETCEIDTGGLDG